MKTRTLIAGLLTLTAISSFTACSDRLGEGRGETVSIPDGTPVDVSFHIGDIKCATKSSFTTAEDAISDLCIIVYKDGSLVTSAYTQDVNGDVIVLRLAKGEQYDLYALANCGEVEFQDEDDLLDYRHQIPSLSSLNSGFPMCWSSLDYTVATSLPDVSIDLERLVAKVTFSLDPGVLDGLEVTSVRLMQSSKAVCPFGISRKALSSAEVMAGDYASADDLSALNGGLPITMYVPENCQGTLLEGNTNPWNKIPDNMAGKGDVCTYIEVGCSFEDGFALTGNVIYRMYLGNDNCANFDVVRNSIYTLALTLTGEGLNEVSWKVDSDVDYNSSLQLAHAWIEQGMHSETNLYIGEIFNMGFTLNASLEKIIGYKLPAGDVVLMSGNGALVQRGSIESGGDEDFYVDVECQSARVDQLYLYDTTTGSRICDLMSCTVRKPYLRISTQSTAEEVHSSISSITPVINGTPVTLCAYLVDSSNENLLGERQYAFNKTYFSDIACSLSTSTSSYGTALSDSSTPRSFSSDVISEGTGQPLASFSILLSIPESKKHSSMATAWAEMYGEQVDGSVPLNVRFSSSNVQSNINVNSNFDIIRPSISWDLLSENTSLTIENPSNIEIKSELWEIMPETNYINNRGAYTAVTTTGYSGLSVPFGTTSLYPLYIHKIAFSTLEQPQYSGTSSSGRISMDYLFRQDCQQTTQNGNARKVVLSTIGGKPFDYDYSCSFEEQTYDDSYPYVYRYDDYDTPHGAALRLPSASGPMRKSGSLGLTGISMTSTYSLTTGDYGHVFRDFIEMHDQRSSRPRTKINITYTNYGLSATITSNPYNISYNVAVEEGTATGTCKWRGYSTASYTTDTHSIPFPFIVSSTSGLSGGDYQYKAGAYNETSVSGTSATAVLTSSAIKDIFQDLNVGCWHNASEKAIASQNNRRSNFTLPQSLTVYLQAGGTTRMVPIDITVNGQTISSTYSVSSTVQGTIYSCTNEGTYSKDGLSANLDRTDRDKKNISSEVLVSSSTAEVSSSKNFTMNIGVGTTMKQSFTYYVR